MILIQTELMFVKMVYEEGNIKIQGVTGQV